MNTFPKHSRASVTAGLIFALALTSACAPRSDTAVSNAIDKADPVSIATLADQHAAFILRSSPEWATQMGVDEDVAGPRFKSRLSAFDKQANEAAYVEVANMLAELEAIDRSSLQGRDQITYDVMHFAYDMAVQQNQFRIGLPSFLSAGPPYVVNQLFGPQIDLPRLLIAQHPVRSQQEAQDWLSRLSQVPRVLNELADAADADARRGVVPPYFSLEAIAASARSLATPATADHPIATSFKSKLDDIDDATTGALYSRALHVLETEVLPAYERFSDRMTALVPLAGRDAGLWRLEQGAAMYQVALEAWGANGLTADEIHQIGLADVARIEGEMDRILRSVGYRDGTVGNRMARLATDTDYHIANTDEAKAELVATLQGNVQDVIKLAPIWFSNLPDYDVEVRRIPVHEQDAASGGYYTPPPLDGSRPGIFWINLKDAKDVPTYTLKSLVFHEAVPGHHFQAASSLSIQGLPLLQNMMWFGDYGEGWALYAEELAKEMGFYEGDALGDLGRYRMELYRAVRLVVDTGLHHKRWGREQAIDYMVNVTGESGSSITREIDRYAVWPGQAASYKLGMIQFQRLRTRAELALGDAFDIRAFHDLVLRNGAMPMATLAMRVDEWITTEKGAQ